MGCAGAKANAVSTAVAQKVRAQRERSRQKFARGPKSHLDSIADDEVGANQGEKQMPVYLTCTY